MSKVVVIIPARYGSTRFPGKPLVDLKGMDGSVRPLIHRTWDAAQQVSGVDEIYVATDDERIAECVQGFGGRVLMTSVTCANGTERCAEAIEKLSYVPDLVINLQGDAPLTPPWFLEDLIAALRDSDVAVATPILRCDAETYGRLTADRSAGEVGGTTAVFDKANRALYFSKEILPFHARLDGEDEVPVFHHVGVYAYRPSALLRYRQWREGPLERNEGLEQLRFLENGEDILCVEVDAKDKIFWEMNNPVDVMRIEEVL